MCTWQVKKHTHPVSSGNLCQNALLEGEINLNPYPTFVRVPVFFPLLLNSGIIILKVTNAKSPLLKFVYYFNCVVKSFFTMCSLPWRFLFYEQCFQESRLHSSPSVELSTMPRCTSVRLFAVARNHS